MDSSSETYDCIVVGLGAHGSCACARLAKNGAKVLGIEQFEDVTHCNGSSHGKSRIIRTAYFESPKYVPLVQRSLALWKESQQEYVDLQRAECTSIADADNINPNPLLVLSGCLIIGKKSTTIVKGTLASARAHKLKYEVLSASEIRTRYNGIFNVDVEDIGVFEPDCGYLIPEACIAAHIRLAQQHRAVTRYGERMLSWEEVFEGEDGDSSPIIIVTTDKGKYRAHKLVLSVGAWAPEIYGHRIVDCMRLQCERRLLWWLDPLRSPTTLGTAETANSSSGKDSSDLSYDNSSTNGTLAIRADNVLLYWAQLVFRWGVNWSQSWWRWLFLPGVKSLQNDETRSSAGSCAFVTQVQARQTQSMIDTCTVRRTVFSVLLNVCFVYCLIDFVLISFACTYYRFIFSVFLCIYGTLERATTSMASLTLKTQSTVTAMAMHSHQTPLRAFQARV